jgi:hypothetical protein
MSASSPQWACRISIRTEYDAHGRRLAEVKETRFGSTITAVQDVELALRRATAAVLNPHVDPGVFLDMADTDTLRRNQDPKQLRFSRNTVVVDISGPDLTDLSFIDLPGESPFRACTCVFLRSSK